MTATTTARSRAHLSLSHASIARGGTPVLTDLSLTVTATSRIAVVGENGRGKSTLLELLSGTLKPDHGTVERHGSLGIAEQEMPAGDGRTVDDAVAFAVAEARAALAALDAAAAALAEDLTGAAQAYEHALDHATAIDAWDAERRVAVALEALGAPSEPTRRLDSMSVGERYRVRLACILGGTYDLLLLDEPTNHLDRHGLEFLTLSLREHPGGVVIVSHDRALLRDVATTVVDLDPHMDGRASIHGDGYEGYVAARAAHLARWEQVHEREVAERYRLEASLASAQDRLVDGWRPPKGTGRHMRATRASGQVTQVKRRQEALDQAAVRTPEPPSRLHVPPLPRARGTVIEAVEVSVAGRLQGPVDVTISGGSRLLVTGANGTGKSTLLRVLAGTHAPTRGTVAYPGRARIGSLAQEDALPGDERADAIYERATASLPQAPSLASLGLLTPVERSRRVRELSTGRQRRLSLALTLAARPHALLLDEPTNHLSISLVDELTEALHATPAAVVVATHDRQLLSDLEEWPRLELTP